MEFLTQQCRLCSIKSTGGTKECDSHHAACCLDECGLAEAGRQYLQKLQDDKQTVVVPERSLSGLSSCLFTRLLETHRLEQEAEEVSVCPDVGGRSW